MTLQCAAMSVPIGEIVEFVDGTYAGPRDLEIAGVAPLSTAANGQLSFLSNPKYASQLATTGAAAILVARSLKGDDGRFIRVDDPYFSLAKVVARWFAKRPMPSGISAQASIASSAKLGSDVVVGAFSVIGDDVTIGDGKIGR